MKRIPKKEYTVIVCREMRITAKTRKEARKIAEGRYGLDLVSVRVRR